MLDSSNSLHVGARQVSASASSSAAKTNFILGLSAFYHDSAAVLLNNGEIVAAAQEERFTRVKHDPCFPAQAIQYCLREARIDFDALEHVIFYDKPLLKFERLLETYVSFAPAGLKSFIQSMPVWAKEKLLMRSLLEREMRAVWACKRDELPTLLFAEHHHSHAASAYFPSPFQDAAVLCVDGVGEWATTSAWMGTGKKLEALWQINFPHSLGLLYSAFTYYCGFKVNSGEYKLMGLAPYGEPKYADLIRSHLIDIKPDGTFRLDTDYFAYCTGDTMTSEKFHTLFSAPPTPQNKAPTTREMDLAASIQVVVEEVMVKLCRTLARESGAKHLCMAGGVALNCVSNGKILRENIFDRIWVQPAAGDAGGALGAAMIAWHRHPECQDKTSSPQDLMQGAYLGPQYSNDEVDAMLDEAGAVHEYFDDDTLLNAVSDAISAGKVVGWFQGRMEFGPRALGGRSILADPRDPEIQSNLNLKIKFRESFRPFAPAILSEYIGEYFDLDVPSPYMMLVAPVAETQRVALDGEKDIPQGMEKLKLKRSTIPAVTHVDYSARIQSIDASTNPRFYALVERFAEKTGCPLLVNTSFNVRGEPIVQSPAEAFHCFLATDMDVLCVENHLMVREQQTRRIDTGAFRQSFADD